ncbi:MAG: hypothetical protein ACKVPJ_13625 [Chitinophagales bacterium]
MQRKITTEDLALFPQLTEKGLNEGDLQEFDENGIPVFEEAAIPVDAAAEEAAKNETDEVAAENTGSDPGDEQENNE